MWTNKKSRKLSHEILGLIGIAASISLLLYLLLSGIASGVTEEYIFNHDIPMTELDWITVYHRIFIVSVILACLSFIVLFLALLSSRIAYIRTITKGICQLHDRQKKLTIPLKGNNELTQLANAINDMSETQLNLREKELLLAQEKEQLIRSLSHDIRTPLTSILAYTEYLSTREEVTPGEQQAYLQLVQKKAGQIRDLTDILLDGGKRNPEVFENARLLMEQLAAEFEETLDDQFEIRMDLSACAPFSSSFDVQELRRIFDNLSSNVQKYADPTQPVQLTIATEESLLLIRQSNAIRRPRPQAEGFQIGLNSIRWIIQHYAGQISITEENGQFAIFLSIPI